MHPGGVPARYPIIKTVPTGKTGTGSLDEHFPMPKLASQMKLLPLPLLLFGVVAMLLSGCSQADLVNWLAPEGIEARG